MLVIFFGVLIVALSAAHYAGVPTDLDQQAASRMKTQVNLFYPTVGGPILERVTGVKTLATKRFRGVIRQQYDYSCGSAALTTILDYYLGYRVTESKVMEGLLRFGESQKIKERRAFSLLDMKRFATALGHKSGGFKADFEDIKNMEQPGIVNIEYAGFKHFVVVKGYYDGHVFVADPALGNISFPEERFKEIWDRNVIFFVFPKGKKVLPYLEVSERDLGTILDGDMINFLVFRHFEPFAKRQDDRLLKAASEIEFTIANPTDPEAPDLDVRTSTKQTFKRQ